MTPIPISAVPDAPTPAQLAGLRDQLEEQRRFRLEQLDELRTLDPHDSSDVTDVLAAGARTALHDVLAALYRMDTGSYGLCTDCGVQLPVERLEVLPQVAQCLPCRAGRTSGTVAAPGH
jgi:RNA polymerase-binding transcription factor DksA